MNLQQKNQIWPDDVLKRFVSNHELLIWHIVDLYNHSRRTANSFIIRMCVRLRTVEVEMVLHTHMHWRTIEYALTYTSGIFEPLADVEEWGESNFQLRHIPDRRIRRRGRDVTSWIHNEMDWAQTHARQQYQAQDGTGPRLKDLHHVVDYVLVSLSGYFILSFCLNSIL
ncbi:hypothetical protein ACS0TY_002679 [Phlomoides rotata]